jgi:hypothetical protein
MGGKCSKRGRDEKCIQTSGRKSGREETGWKTGCSNSSVSLSRDRSIVPSKLSFSVFGERLSSKSYNVVVFPFAFHIAVQQPLKPL